MVTSNMLLLLPFAFNACLKRLFQAVFQVGDFGFWPRGRRPKLDDPYYKREDALDFFLMQSAPDLYRFFSAGEAVLKTLRTPLYFIRGNHEDFERLQTLSKEHPTEVLSRIFFLPDYFAGEVSGLHIAAVGGILTDVDRGKGKQARMAFKKAQQQVQIDPRRTNAVLLAQTLLPHYDLLLTHSGLSSQETRDGSRQLETYLHQQTIRLHFYGHHHRFSHGLRNEFLYVRVGSMPGHIVSPACRFPPLRSRMQICARSSHALREESRAMCQLIRGVVES
jgi:hypothetical protein